MCLVIGCPVVLGISVHQFIILCPQLRKEVRRQMALEGDYAAWYYNPTQAKYTRMWKKEREDEQRMAGSF